MKVAVIGAGWAGMAAAIAHAQAGREVTVFEAARTVGGRARAVPATLPQGATVLDVARSLGPRLADQPARPWPSLGRTGALRPRPGGLR